MSVQGHPPSSPPCARHRPHDYRLQCFAVLLRADACRAGKGQRYGPSWTLSAPTYVLTVYTLAMMGRLPVMCGWCVECNRFQAVARPVMLHDCIAVASRAHSHPGWGQNLATARNVEIIKGSLYHDVHTLLDTSFSRPGLKEARAEKKGKKGDNSSAPAAARRVPGACGPPQNQPRTALPTLRGRDRGLHMSLINQ